MKFIPSSSIQISIHHVEHTRHHTWTF